MLRNVLSVIVGYITMAAIIFIAFTAAYLAMGDDGAFKEGSYEVSSLWVTVTIVVGLIAALMGGIVCSLVSRCSKGAVTSLVVLVIVLGGVSAAMGLMKEKPAGPDAVRTPETSNTEAMMKAQQPTWILIVNPIIGVVGVMLGAKLVAGGGKDTAAE